MTVDSSPSKVQATLKQAQQLGLLEEEYIKICEVLGRKPNFTELSVYSVMWSEHCAYKNSILWLKKLPKEGKNVLAGAGEENAGLMDIGDGLAVCFKIESHNHPSAIEPYQGAATGVGGIHRDIFSMGARPVAALNSLRFGDLKLAKTKHLLKGVVKGIGDYGNAFGVPTVGGEAYFDKCYNTNPLVNAMSVGIVKHGETASAIASGIGNPVFIVGAATGKDGIHGATFASGDITEDSANDLPSVQVGDPFTEKLLLEATLELIQTGTVVGIQDMGAAGIACSTSETAAKGKTGMDVWLDKVPTRQANMKPYEILLSESQERMLIILEKGKEETALQIFDKWDLNCAQVGIVTNSGNIRYFMHGEKVGEIPAESLVLGGGAPVYERSQRTPEYYLKRTTFSPEKYNDKVDINATLKQLLSLPEIASKRWIQEQYDSMVGAANMSTNAPSAAPLVNIKGTSKALAMTVDCNSRYVKLDPQKGTEMAVAEAARNIACSGGVPLGITNCLNFGNPYNPEVYWQFANAILGMKAACEAFQIPVTGGNVSFYNQSSDDGPVNPTPTIGMVGLLEDVAKMQMTLNFKTVGDLIYLIGNPSDDFAGSTYLFEILKASYSPAPKVELKEEANLVNGLLKIISEQLIQSAHDLSEGGLTIALIESGIAGDKGFDINFADSFRQDGFLFGESGGRAIVSLSPHKQEAFEKTLSQLNLNFLRLGKVTEEEVHINKLRLGTIREYQSIYENSLEKNLI